MRCRIRRRPQFRFALLGQRDGSETPVADPLAPGGGCDGQSSDVLLLRSGARPSDVRGPVGDHRGVQSPLPGVFRRKFRRQLTGPRPEVCADLEAFLAARGPLDVLQLSGGEPLLHPELLAIIDHCRRLPIEQVVINTNGLELAWPRRPGRGVGRPPPAAAAFSPTRRPGRRKPPCPARGRLVGPQARGARCDRAPRLAHQPGLHGRQGRQRRPVGRAAASSACETPQIRGITYQPATWSGRFQPAIDPMDRVTMADVIRLLGPAERRAARRRRLPPAALLEPQLLQLHLPGAAGQAAAAAARAHRPLRGSPGPAGRSRELQARRRPGMLRLRRPGGGILPRRRQAVHGRLHLRRGSGRRVLHSRHPARRRRRVVLPLQHPPAEAGTAAGR